MAAMASAAVRAERRWAPSSAEATETLKLVLRVRRISSAAHSAKLSSCRSRWSPYH
jgi:hypothetical protein